MKKFRIPSGIRPALRRIFLTLPALGVLCPLPTLAQDPVRAYTMGDPLPGREAPAFVLPFARADGPAPEGQEFSLSAELGRVVILAFCPTPSDSATAETLRALQAEADSLSAQGIVVAVALPDGVTRLAETASRFGLSYKLLADSVGRVRRLYGVDRREVGVYVIGPTGRVEWRDLRFRPMLATSYGPLWQAVGAARAR